MDNDLLLAISCRLSDIEWELMRIADAAEEFNDTLKLLTATLNERKDDKYVQHRNHLAHHGGTHHGVRHLPVSRDEMVRG